MSPNVSIETFWRHFPPTGYTNLLFLTSSLVLIEFPTLEISPNEVSPNWTFENQTRMLKKANFSLYLIFKKCNLVICKLFFYFPHYLHLKFHSSGSVGAGAVIRTYLEKTKSWPSSNSWSQQYKYWIKIQEETGLILDVRIHHYLLS